MKTKFIEPLKDFTFKTVWLMGNKDAKEYLKRIVSYLARKDIRKYTNYNCELCGNNYQSIQSITDLLLVSKDKLIKINVEVNRKHEVVSDRKNEIYIHKIAGNFYNDIDKNYDKEIRVEQININGYYCPEDKSIKINEYTLYDKENHIEKQSITIKNIYLSNYQNKCYDEIEDINNDFAMLVCNSYEEMEYYIRGNKERKGFVEELKKLGSSEAFLNLYDYEEYQKALERDHIKKATEKGLKQGLKQGLKEGIEQGLLQSAQKMLDKGMSKEEVANILEIDLKVLKDIQ